MAILAGDIGGTKTNLALYDVGANERLTLIQQQRFPSRDYQSLEALVKEFTKGCGHQLTASCLGIPGPVIGGESRTTNLPWVVTEKSVAAALGLDHVDLINDLEATAYGIQELSDDQLKTINQGVEERNGNRALIAAGTGLGVAALVWDGARYRVIASEGGHADFPPRNELEMDLLRYLLTLYAHVSCERVLSGPGLVNIYNFLKLRDGAEEPVWLAEALAASDDQAKTISQMASEGKSELPVKALAVFVSIYGALAGNLALTFKATGGVYIGGGIAPKIGAKLADGTFLKAFKDKGRLSAMVDAVPVHIIMNPMTALVGAAEYAAHQLRG
jgi:glucokinase